MSELNRAINLYKATLEVFIQQEKEPADSVCMKTCGLEDKLEKAISLRTDEGEAYFYVRKTVKLLRKQLYENL